MIKKLDIQTLVKVSFQLTNLFQWYKNRIGNNGLGALNILISWKLLTAFEWKSSSITLLWNNVFHCLGFHAESSWLNSLRMITKYIFSCKMWPLFTFFSCDIDDMILMSLSIVYMSGIDKCNWQLGQQQSCSLHYANSVLEYIPSH